MKLIILLFNIIPVISQTQINCELLTDTNYTGYCFEIDGNDSTIIWYKHGQETGKRISYRTEEGQIRYKQKKRSESSFTVIRKKYWNNGNLQFKISIKNGKGFIKFYNQDKSLKSYGQFYNGCPSGIWEVYDTIGKFRMHSDSMINTRLKSVNDIWSVAMRNFEIMSLKNNPNYPGKIVITQNYFSKQPPDYLLNFDWHSDSMSRCWKNMDNDSLILRTSVINNNITIGHLIEANLSGYYKQDVYIFFGELKPFLELNLSNISGVIAYCWYLDSYGNWIEEERGATLIHKEYLAFDGPYFPCEKK